MEPLFTNTCNLTRKHYQDANFQLFKSRRLIFIIIYSMLILTEVFLFFLWGDIAFLVFAFLLALFIGYRYAFLPIHGARIHERRNWELFKETPVQIARFFDDRIEITMLPMNSALTITYDQIKRIESTKSLYFIIIREKMFIMLDKGTFENINLIEFECFVSEKTVNAKVLL